MLLILQIDPIVDEVSEKDGTPISYRAPRRVLGMLNSAMKEKVPYFATLAEYMLWDNYYKEYHQDMGFDVLWGNDIVCIYRIIIFLLNAQLLYLF